MTLTPSRQLTSPEVTPSAGGRRGWPLPEDLGSWGSEAEFTAQRPEAGQWVFWEDRVELALAGRYHEVLPLHVEVSPTYLCNFACPWCSCRSARGEWAEDDVFHHPRATPLTVMRKPRLEAVIDHLAEHNVEIMWVGGEPTMNPLLYPAAARAAEVGLNQCIFTNGSLFKPDQARALYDAGLVFIRVSLNAVTPEVHQRHHDYDPRRPYAERVLSNVEMLAELRAENRSRTLLGISVVVDERNVNDLQRTAEFLAAACGGSRPGRIDYVMVRPAFPLTGAEVDLSDSVVAEFARQTAEGSDLRRLLADAGIQLVIPEQSVARSGSQKIPEDDIGCLAAGWFGEVTPSGDMLPCSDLYGDPDFVIGNVEQESLHSIWNSARRGLVLDKVRTEKCASRRCPSNGRGYHLNRTFRRLEDLRRSGRLEVAQDWIDDIRRVLPRPEHSFFI
ncbi:MAG TPA: radical SAM protein [Streptosporangiaceae bacterium]|nr:radical SAM protein [Streptosporangiaceae bacterium]